MAKVKPKPKPAKKSKSAAVCKPAAQSPSKATATAAARRNERQRGYLRDKSADTRECGPLPKVKKPKRRAAAAKSLKAFCETYLRRRFPLAWSPFHLTLIAVLESCIRQGGQHAFATPRGSGKTSLALAAALWAGLNGYRKYIVVVAGTAPLAAALLRDLRAELEGNDLLAADYPEVCHPIWAIEGIVNRCAGQTLNGERTKVTWNDKKVVLPTVKGKPTSGVVIQSYGLTGSIRGLRHTVGGKTLRPDVLVIDDPQTRGSATSLSQVVFRESLIAGDLLGLAGPDQKLAAVMACTVIAPGDVADHLLDRKLHPAWRGTRVRMLESMPTNIAMWEEYARIRSGSFERGGDGREATEFYKANRAAMDAGAEATWPERHRDDELSAVQHAMNLRMANPAAFEAEYQNAPVPLGDATVTAVITPELVLGKIVPLARGVVPRECVKLTAFIDVQQEILYFAVVAWDARFGGHVVDYGTFPQQNRAYFAANDARPSLSTVFPGVAESAAIYAGLGQACELVVGRSFPREDSTDAVKVERCLIDANWGRSTDTVYQFIRRSNHAAVLLASHGRGIGPAKAPMSVWASKPGDQVGWNYRVQSGTGANRGRHCTYDANRWKTFLAERLHTPKGSPGCLTVFHEEPHVHRLFVDHLSAETSVETSGPYGRVDVWSLRAGAENHWLDGCSGAAVAAAVSGMKWSASGVAEVRSPMKSTVSAAEAQAARRAAGPVNAGRGRRIEQA